MRCPNQETYDPGCLWENSVINKERSNTLNANSPPIHLLDSNIIKEDTQNSDYSMSLSEEGFIYAYCQTFSEKANPRENSGIYSTTESSLSKSQESSNTDRYCTPFSRSRTFSNLPSELCTNLTCSQKVNTHKPKVLKYIRNFSQSFCKFEKLTVNNDSDSDVIFLKAEHELDGQTYILKRRKLFIENDEEIKDHQAYKEILSLNSTSLPLNVRYVNSWVELDQDYTNDELKCYQEDGINVILYIQMRHIKDLNSLACDLILSSNKYRNLDEDDIEELVDNTIDKINSIVDNGVSLKEAIFQTFSTIGFSEDELPQTIEQKAWRICLDEFITSA